MITIVISDMWPIGLMYVGVAWALVWMFVKIINSGDK